MFESNFMIQSLTYKVTYEVILKLLLRLRIKLDAAASAGLVPCFNLSGATFFHCTKKITNKKV